MYIKRNVKKIPVNNTGFHSQSQKLKSTGLGKYRYPTCDMVPSGIYFSEITSVKNTTTNNGKPAIDVTYVIRNASICRDIVNGILPENVEKKLYYIKQRYHENTTHYESFVDAMSQALGLKENEEFDIDNTVGLTELISLSYCTSNSLGSIDARKPFSSDDFWDPRLHSDEENEGYI